MCIGDVCVSNVQFGVADKVKSTTGYAIGLMGLGYSLNEATHHQYPNMPEVLKDAGEINSRLYSVYLNDEGATSGSILFGGIDSSKYTGPLQTLDLLPEIKTHEIFQFITTVTAMTAKVNGQTNHVFSGGSPGYAAYGQYDHALPVLLDTGSSAWSVPPSYYQLIMRNFPYVDSHGLCPCSYADSADSVTLTFGGKVDITIPAKEFIVPLYNATTNTPYHYNAKEQACAFMIVPDTQGTGQGFETLGDAILRSMYVIFDLDEGQVSVAQANVNSTAAPNIQVVAAGPSGVANAANNVRTAPNQSVNTIAPQMNATVSFKAMSAKSTIGTATGAAAVPADAHAGSSGGSSSSSKSSGAAVGITIPGADWTGLWVSGIAVVMAALGAGLVL